MKIAIVGAGVSGIYAAYKLAPAHDVTLYEAGTYLGGHTDTHHISLENQTFSVDTGFIVFNELNYPLFTAFLSELGVAFQQSDMSFSVSHAATGLEYNTTDLGALFCQKRNLLSPRFYAMLYDILRFYKQSPKLLQSSNDELTIGEYLAENGYGSAFIDDHLMPMASALWSSPPTTVTMFPARYFVSFMHNHSMLQISGRPAWRTITGGSSMYVESFTRRFQGNVRVNTRVNRVNRSAGGVMIETASDASRFDAVILACHSDQALQLLSDANDQERKLLSAILYQENEAILHTDSRMMPRLQNAWASWNAFKLENSGDCIVTYCMNKLQRIETNLPLLVSLNAADHVARDKVLLRRRYHHPIYTPKALLAQRELQRLSGRNQTYFAGAYLGWGFHEDGVQSAQRAVDLIDMGEFANAA